MSSIINRAPNLVEVINMADDIYVYRTVIGTMVGDMKILGFDEEDKTVYKVECCKCKRIYKLNYKILHDKRCNLHMFACTNSNKLR